MRKDFYNRERESELRRIRKQQRQAAVRAWQHRVSQLREQAKKRIVDPVMHKHMLIPKFFDYHDPELESARRVVNMTVGRILASPSAPLPLETSVLLGSNINDNGFLKPQIGFTERSDDEVFVQHGTSGEIVFDNFDVQA